MGVFRKFEQKVEGAVNEAFARAFKGDVQPVEISARLQRELDGEAKLVSRDRRLVPNEFSIALSPHDHDKLTPHAATLSAEFTAQLKQHASERGYVFSGPVRVAFSLDPSLPTGRFTLSSQTVAGIEVPPPSAQRLPTPTPQPPVAPRPTPPARTWAEAPQPPADTTPEPSAQPPRPAPPVAPQHGLVLEVNGLRHPLVPPGITIGRGTDADLRINDPGISRLHAEIRVRVDGSRSQIEIVDLGSTNGILVNGEKVRTCRLAEGSRIQIGSTRMLVHDPSGS